MKATYPRQVSIFSTSEHMLIRLRNLMSYKGALGLNKPSFVPLAWPLSLFHLNSCRDVFSFASVIFEPLCFSLALVCTMAGLSSAVPGEEGEHSKRVTHHKEGWLGVHQPCARRCALQETFVRAVTSTLLPPTNCSHVTPKNEQSEQFVFM